MKKLYTNSCLMILKYPFLSYIISFIIINVFYVLFNTNIAYTYYFDTWSSQYDMDNNQLPGETPITNKEWNILYNTIKEKKENELASRKAMYIAIEDGFGKPPYKVIDIPETPNLLTSISYRQIDMTLLSPIVQQILTSVDAEFFLIEKKDILDLQDPIIQRIFEIYKEDFNNFENEILIDYFNEFAFLIRKTNSVTIKYAYICFRTLFAASFTSSMLLHTTIYDNRLLLDYISDYNSERDFVLNHYI